MADNFLTAKQAAMNVNGRSLPAHTGVELIDDARLFWKNYFGIIIKSKYVNLP